VREQSRGGHLEAVVLHRLMRQDGTLCRQDVRAEVPERRWIRCRRVLNDEHGVHVAEPRRAPARLAPVQHQVDDRRVIEQRAEALGKARGSIAGLPPGLPAQPLRRRRRLRRA
jgi:hypothetical protein